MYFINLIRLRRYNKTENIEANIKIKIDVSARIVPVCSAEERAPLSSGPIYFETTKESGDGSSGWQRCKHMFASWG